MDVTLPYFNAAGEFVGLDNENGVVLFGRWRDEWHQQQEQQHHQQQGQQQQHQQQQGQQNEMQQQQIRRSNAPLVLNGAPWREPIVFAQWREDEENRMQRKRLQRENPEYWSRILEEEKRAGEERRLRDLRLVRTWDGYKEGHFERRHNDGSFFEARKFLCSNRQNDFFHFQFVAGVGKAMGGSSGGGGLW
ncbi:hypothetical protein niasHT_038788 [Heterodera trifolii]|uniref:Uncharacterized protein n=1 Tax=Heterodera trifolii TaxID=157864 RepID=A0ABD2IQR8_9BILA